LKIQAAAEDYLEAIFILSKDGNVRAVDLAAHMGFSKPTISIFLKQFRENGYVYLDSDRNIFLTDQGLEIAQNIYERHNLLANVLIAIGVDEETAYKEACKIEHNISDTTFECITRFYEKHLKGNHFKEV